MIDPRIDDYAPDEDDVDLVNGTLASVDEGLISAQEATDLLNVPLADVLYWLRMREPEPEHDPNPGQDLPF